MFGRTFTSVSLALFVGLFTCLLYAEPSAALPSGFQDASVADIPSPTALAFTPGGRMLVTSKPGQLYVYESGQKTQALGIGSRVCSNSERGLLGVAVDPEFATNHYVYLYYTYNKSGVCPAHEPARNDNPVNRVSRFVMSGDAVDPNSERVLIDNIPSPNGNHNAGDLHFGKNGYLYVSVGDGGCDYAEPTRCQYENDASRDRHVLLGKVLRIQRDGGIPASNPYTGPNSERCNRTGRTERGNNCRETFARGFRNPFRMAFDPDAAGTRFNINDVGGGKWEEIDRGQRGADYGWNLCEGRHDNPYRTGSVNCSGVTYKGPIHEYSHSTGCESITGGAFVPDGAWPAPYNDAYLFGDYVCGKIFKLTPGDGGGFKRELFAGGLGGGGPIAMTFGPYGTEKALYYTTFAGGGQVRRIAYTAGNRSPVASVRVVGDNFGPSTKQFEFDGSGSSDPDAGDTLTYEWDFTSDGTVDATGAAVTHTYEAPGKHTASLTVRDGNGGRSTDTVEVFPGDTPPVPVIDTPASGALFRVGEEITLNGSADDAEDGHLADSALSWRVLQHHDGNHTHPLLGPTPGNNPTFTAPAPEGLFSTDPAGNYLEIRLTATDAQGLSRTVVRELRPNTVEIGFGTQPSGLRLRVNGEAFRAPKTFVSWEGYNLNVFAPRQEDPDGRLWGFRSWSDGGTQKHTIKTPAAPTTYTATFERLRR